MKKIKLLAVLMLCPIMLFGQLEVRPDGRVAASNGIFSNTSSVNFGFAISPVLASVGLRGVSSNQNAGGSIPVVNIGVYGAGSENPSNRNIGVLGRIPGSGSGQPQQNGSAIVGAIGNHIPISFSRPYAGFFAGNVNVQGNVTATNFLNNSDFRYKENIASLSSSRSRNLSNVLMLNPVSYNLVQRYHEFQDSTGVTIREAIISEHSQLLDRHHYGLIAQEVQQLFPNLVFEDGEGYLSINYIGLIPLLIQTLQEQNARIELLERSGGGLIPFGARAVSNTDDIFTEQIERSATLYQNTPNPFSQSTEIRFYLPTSVSNAILAIYDLNGRQIKQLRISERGESSLVISGSQLAPGMYLYALIADGKKIDVKRMILTE